MFTTIRARLFAAFLAVWGAALLAAIIGLFSVGVLSQALREMRDGAWPTADMCMEFWIGSLRKNHAGDRYAEGDTEGGREELSWARRFVADSLRAIEKAGRIPAPALEEMTRLDRECDAVVNRLLNAADRERALAGDEAAVVRALAEARDGDPSGAGSAAIAGMIRRREAIGKDLASARIERRVASRALDGTLMEIESLIAPLEDRMDLEMDSATEEGILVARRARWLLLIVAVSSVACAVGAGAALTSQIVRPLKRLTEMTGRIAEGRLTDRVGIVRRDELGELATRFDRMAGDLETSRNQLLASQARYRSLFEYARDAVVVLDGDGGIIEANAVFSRMVGVTRDVPGNRTFQDHLPPGDRSGFLERLSVMVGPGNPLAEVEIVGAGGARIPTEAGAVRLPDGRTVIGLRDLTQRRRLELAVIQSEKLSAIGQLAAGVAHELRNPLFVISNVLYDLREILGTGRADVDENLRLAAEENRRAREIIDNLLEFARPVDGRAAALEIDGAIQQILRLFRESLAQRRIELRTALAATRPCRFHPDAFKQVLVNLLSNAIDAMPEGGRLTVASRALEDGHVEVLVKDTGVGIPEEKQKEIFNPFYSTKPPGRGTGLGLWIVHLTVQRYRGRISVESAEGAGAAFRLVLPEAAGAA